MQFKLPTAVLLGALALSLAATHPVPVKAASAEAEAIVIDVRPSAELSDKELRQRMQALKGALDRTDLADAIRKELRAMLRADRSEQETRTAASAGSEAGGETAAGEQPADTTSSGDAGESAATDSAGGGSEVATIESVVSSTQPRGELSDEALQGRLAEIDAGLARGELPRALKRQLRDLQKADQAEMERRRQSVAAEQPAGSSSDAQTASEESPPAEEPAASEAEVTSEEPPPVDAPVAGETAQPADEPSVTATGESDTDRESVAASSSSNSAPASSNAASEARKLLLSSRSLDQLSERDLRQRLSDARQLLSDRSLPANLRGKLTALTSKIRNEIRRRGGSTTVENGVVKPKKKAATTTTSNAAEEGTVTTTGKKRISNADRQALALINDATRPERLPRNELRRRLDTYRTLLASGALSPDVEDQLREKLKRERSLLRERVAVEEVQATGSTDKAKRRERVAVKIAVPEPTVSEAPRLATDRRRATELNERQLNRRILAYRVLNRSDQISAEERAAYRERIRADRAELRRRLLEDKRRRVVEVRKAPRIQVDIDLGVDTGTTVWVAEAGDEEIERHLTARPIRRIRERYPRRIILEQPEQIVTREDVRESLPSVEIDTINFGFNESFVAEEEIADLDLIGTILERILANHPDEVFLIEGHTDAVGSDGYNLRLSLERARAVKAALIDYYAISPDSLSVVGLGERYLKIPTLEPEEENRRVTVRRVTSLLSEYDPE
jgi:outer membrane protein OmpA-like peptidoglycan-associated protein